MSAEMFRRVRLGDMSLGRDPRPGMIQASKDYAPWAWERRTNVEQVIDQILAMPARQRRITARALGERMNVTNEERERLTLRTILPVDMTDEQLAEQKKAKDRARKRRRRQASGAVSRAEYLAASKSREEPWKADNICRRTWERRCRKAVASPSSIKKSIPRTHSRHDAPEPANRTGKGRAGTEQSAPVRGAPSPFSIFKPIEMASTRLCAEP